MGEATRRERGNDFRMRGLDWVCDGHNNRTVVQGRAALSTLLMQ